MRKVRIAILLGMLIALSGWWGSQHWHGYIFWQGSCDGEKPQWFNELVTLAREQGYPGFQLSLQAKDGSRLSCTAGQVGPRLNLKAMQTSDRMRYASLSKLLTSIVSQQLIAEERLLADSYLLDYFGSDVVVQDERVRKITIGQLLRHTAGFDRHLTPDPMMKPTPWCPFQLEGLSHVVLDHEPGSRYVYSNLGYCLLGAVIERVEGKTLSEVFKARIFKPASVVSLAPAKQWEFANDEVIYRYQQPEQEQQLIGLSYSSMLAVGAWTGTASDFLELMSTAFIEEKILDSRSKKLLFAVSEGCDISRWRHCHGNAFYAYQETPQEDKFYWRDGSLPGVTSFAGISDGGQLIVFTANSRPYNWVPANDRLGLFLYRNLVAREFKQSGRMLNAY